MESLQRSAISFRRQGSSGFVWDDKFLAGEFNKLANERKEKEESSSGSKENKENPATSAVNKSPPPPQPAGLVIDRSRSNGGRGFRTGKVSPAVEPPSPRVSAFGCCGAFGKGEKTRRRPPKSGKRVM
ncbi:MAPK kinase substrate protein At1g80180-like [Salvia splendens]|uniref:MAPK kinase substrate protein At1g80180-like n=1 Tax=Salvia splendens TaxID=180675 RepID=UPI001C257D36|nr:MAPK kinase substrate protein At1g80180-like [Salvia splendens]